MTVKLFVPSVMPQNLFDQINMTIKEALLWATKRLSEEGSQEPKASAEVLLGDVLGLTRTEMAAHSDRMLRVGELIKFKRYIKRRLGHEPVWQIIGKVDFWGMSYLVDKNVLVPRPETEILVTEVLKFAKEQKESLKILDLGTGSGTIIIALASELSGSTFYASDISPKALKIAKKNASLLLRTSRVRFKEGNLLEPWRGEQFDIIVTNLPYIPHEDMSSLAFDVLHHEPRLALDGGAAGLELYEKFFQTVGNHIKPGSAIFCEIGIDQGQLIKEMVKKFLPSARVKVLGDLAGIDRVVIIEVAK